MNWNQIFIVAGITASAAVILYYLLDGEENEPEKTEKSKVSAALVENNNALKKAKKKRDVHEVTIDELIPLMRAFHESQEKLSVCLSILTDEAIQHNYTFDQAYHRLLEMNLDDPISDFGLLPSEYNFLIEKFDCVPSVKELKHSTNSISSSRSVVSGGRKDVTVDDILDMHKYMIAELQRLLDRFKKMPAKEKETYNMRIYVIAAQVIIGLDIEKKFQVVAEEVELYMLRHADDFVKQAEFYHLCFKLHEVMEQLLGEEASFNPARMGFF